MRIRRALTPQMRADDGLCFRFASTGSVQCHLIADAHEHVRVRVVELGIVIRGIFRDVILVVCSSAMREMIDCPYRMRRTNIENERGFTLIIVLLKTTSTCIVWWPASVLGVERDVIPAQHNARTLVRLDFCALSNAMRCGPVKRKMKTEYAAIQLKHVVRCRRTVFLTFCTLVPVEQRHSQPSTSESQN